MEASDFLEYEHINKDKFTLQIRVEVLSSVTFWNSTMSLNMSATRNMEEKQCSRQIWQSTYLIFKCQILYDHGLMRNFLFVLQYKKNILKVLVHIHGYNQSF